MSCDRRRRIGLAGWTAIGTLLLTSAGCHRPPGSPPSSGGSASSEAILVMLSEARAWQRRADLKLSDGNIVGAIAAVREVLTIPFPEGVAEAEDIRLDASARLAKLYLGQAGEEGEQQALAQIEEGRRIASRDSFFRANLESVAADIYESRANRIGSGEAQAQAKRQADEALARSIQIAQRLRRLLNLPPESQRDAGPREIP